MPRNDARIARALGRVSLVLFLTMAVSYQSWSIIVLPDNSDFLFSPTAAAKLIPAFFDIDDEHRGGHALLSILPAALFAIGASVFSTQTRGRFISELRYHYSALQRLTVVLLI